MNEKLTAEQGIKKAWDIAYGAGREDEKKEWIDSVMPETAVITIRVRDKNNQVEIIRNVITFDQIKQGRTHMLQLIIEQIFLNIATGKILKNLIEPNPQEK